MPTSSEVTDSHLPASAQGSGTPRTRTAVTLIEVDPTFGTDRLTSGLLGFAGGGQLAFSVSTEGVRYQRMQLVGTTGRIEIEAPFNAPEAEPCRSMNAGLATERRTAWRCAWRSAWWSRRC